MNKEKFLNDIIGQNNHRIMLWHALELTNGLVVEFGSGYGSTPYIREYCNDYEREFKTFESNGEWAEKMGSRLINNWDSLPEQKCDVLLIDHAPGERRKIDIMQNHMCAKIMVVHDTEIAADHGYQMRDQFDFFKYGVELNTPGGGAGAAMLSNHIPLDHLIGQSWGKWEITKITKS